MILMTALRLSVAPSVSALWWAVTVLWLLIHLVGGVVAAVLGATVALIRVTLGRVLLRLLRVRRGVVVVGRARTGVGGLWGGDARVGAVGGGRRGASIVLLGHLGVTSEVRRGGYVVEDDMRRRDQRASGMRLARMGRVG